MLQMMYKVKKPHKLGSLWMVTLNKWDKKGKYFTPEQLLKILHKYFSDQPGIETFPDDWEVIEYHLIETKQIKPQLFIKWKTKKPFVKGI